MGFNLVVLLPPNHKCELVFILGSHLCGRDTACDSERKPPHHMRFFAFNCMGSIRSQLHKKGAASFFFLPYWIEIAWVFIPTGYNSCNRTVFCNLFWSVIKFNNDNGGRSHEQCALQELRIRCISPLHMWTGSVSLCYYVNSCQYCLVERVVLDSGVNSLYGNKGKIHGFTFTGCHWPP